MYASVSSTGFCRTCKVKGLMGKLKSIVMIDWTLIPLFVLTVYTGLKFHGAGHSAEPELIHAWMVRHFFISFVLLIVCSFHLKSHRYWYKGILKNGLGKKSKVTLFLSFIFLLVSITGFMLLGVSGMNTPLGLLHYKMGFVLVILGIWHILKRGSALLKINN